MVGFTHVNYCNLQYIHIFMSARVWVSLHPMYLQTWPVNQVTGYSIITLLLIRHNFHNRIGHIHGNIASVLKQVLSMIIRIVTEKLTVIRVMH